MTPKHFISSLIGPTAFLAASLMACVSEDGGSGASTMRVATVDFGSGPIEIQFEDRDGEAIFEGDIVLGKTEDVQRGVVNLFWPSGPKGQKPPVEPNDSDTPEDPAAVDEQEARYALESPEPSEDPNALDELEVLERPELPKAPPWGAHAALSHLNPWSGGRIPFVIDGDLPQAVQNRIAEAMAGWEEKTIVRFVPHASGSLEHFVRFTGPTRSMGAGEGNSAIGFFPAAGTPQLIRLGDDVALSTIRHEIGHAVGLFHEQSRTDRDDFIEINWANIQLDKWGNFMTYVASGFGGLDYRSYDIESLMHYGSFTFAVDPSVPTIVKRGCSLVSTDPDCLITPSSNLTSRDRKGVTRLVSGDPPFKFRVRNEANNRCLRPSEGTTAANARVILSSCDNTPSRRWYEFTRAGTTVPMIVNEHSRLCLARDTNNNLIQAHCRGNASQRYRTIDAGFDAIFGGDVLRSNGRCLTRVAGESQPRMGTSCSTNEANRRWHKDLL